MINVIIMIMLLSRIINAIALIMDLPRYAINYAFLLNSKTWRKQRPPQTKEAVERACGEFIYIGAWSLSCKASLVSTEALLSVHCQRVALAPITDRTPENLETALAEKKKERKKQLTSKCLHGEKWAFEIFKMCVGSFWGLFSHGRIAVARAGSCVTLKFSWVASFCG